MESSSTLRASSSTSFLYTARISIKLYTMLDARRATDIQMRTSKFVVHALEGKFKIIPVTMALNMDAKLANVSKTAILVALNRLPPNLTENKLALICGPLTKNPMHPYKST